MTISREEFKTLCLEGAASAERSWKDADPDYFDDGGRELADWFFDLRLIWLRLYDVAYWNKWVVWITDEG